MPKFFAIAGVPARPAPDTTNVIVLIVPGGRRGERVRVGDARRAHLVVRDRPADARERRRARRGRRERQQRGRRRRAARGSVIQRRQREFSASSSAPAPLPNARRTEELHLTVSPVGRRSSNVQCVGHRPRSLMMRMHQMSACAPMSTTTSTGGPVRGRGDDARLDPGGDRFETRAGAELRQNPLHVIAHGHRADVQRAGDARRSTDPQRARQSTSRSRALSPLPAGDCRRRGEHRGDRAPRATRRSRPPAAPRAGPRRAILRHDPGAPGVTGRSQRRFVAQPGHHEHAGVRRQTVELGDALGRVTVGEPVVEEHDVGVVPLDRTDRLGDAVCDIDDDEIGLVARGAERGCRRTCGGRRRSALASPAG